MTRRYSAEWWLIAISIIIELFFHVCDFHWTIDNFNFQLIQKSVRFFPEQQQTVQLMFNNA